ncbi:unnamed protein product [Closterium sp. NIES-53]
MYRFEAEVVTWYQSTSTAHADHDPLTYVDPRPANFVVTTFYLVAGDSRHPWPEIPPRHFPVILDDFFNLSGKRIVDASTIRVFSSNIFAPSLLVGPLPVAPQLLVGPPPVAPHQHFYPHPPFLQLNRCSSAAKQQRSCEAEQPWVFIMAFTSPTIANPITPLRLEADGSSSNFKAWSYGVDKHLLSRDVQGLDLKDVLLNRGKGKQPLLPRKPFEPASDADTRAYEEAAEKYRKWEKADATIISVFIASTPPELVNTFHNYPTSNAIWKYLQDRFMNKTAVGVAILIPSMFQVRLEDCSGMANYIAKVQIIHGELKELGIVFPEQAPPTTLLVGLTSAYEVTRKMLLTLSAEDLTFAKVSSALLSVEKDSMAQAKAYTLRALVPQESVASAPFQRNRFPPCTYVVKYGNRKGQVCGGTNHPLATCFKKKDDEWYAIHGVDKKPLNWIRPRKANLVEAHDPASVSASDSAPADCDIIDPVTNKVLARFTLNKNNLYTLRVPIPQASTTQAQAEATPCSCRSLANLTILYHHRLGHPNFRTLADMASKKQLLGLPASLPPPPDSPMPSCFDCTKSKLRQQPHPPSPSVANDRTSFPCFSKFLSQPPLQPASSLPAPSPYTEQTGGLTERREPASRPALSVRAVPTGHPVLRQHPPPVPGTHHMALCPSSVPQRVPLPSPPASSLADCPDPESNLVRTASPTLPRVLATVVTDPSFESVAASALVVELVEFAAACRLDYAAGLVAESEFDSPPSVGGECALGTDVLEDRQGAFECFAVVVSHLVSMLLAPKGDPDAPDIPTPRSFAEAITGPYSSQWQTAMDAEMTSWKSTGTYVDAVPPPWANIVDGMWIFRVKQPPGSPPAFNARYVARGFSQRHGVHFFQTFSPTPKMTTLRVLLHVVAQRDYELHSLDFSTTFLQGSLHKEIWLRRPPGFTGSFPAGTQWSLRRPVYGFRQAPREWHDTLRMTLVALGFAPSTADPSLFLHTDTSLPPFYILVYVDDLVFATADTEGLALMKSKLQKRHTCTDLGPLALRLPVLLATVHSSAYRSLALNSTFGRVRDTDQSTGRHRPEHWEAAKRVLRYVQYVGHGDFATGGTGAGGAGVPPGVGGPGGAGAAGPGGARTGGTGAARAGGAGGARAGDPGAGGARVGSTGAGAAGGTGARADGGSGAGAAGGTRAAGGTGAAGPGGARSGSTGAAGAGGAASVGAGDPGAGDTGAGGAGPGGAGAVGSQLSLQPASPLPGPSAYTEQTGGLTEHREPLSRPASPVRDVRTGRRVSRMRPPSVSGTHHMALCLSSVPQRVPLPSPTESCRAAAYQWEGWCLPGTTNRARTLRGREPMIHSKRGGMYLGEGEAKPREDLLDHMRLGQRNGASSPVPGDLQAKVALHLTKVSASVSPLLFLLHGGQCALVGSGEDQVVNVDQNKERVRATADEQRRVGRQRKEVTRCKSRM